MNDRERAWVGCLIGVGLALAYFPAHNDLFIVAGTFLVLASLLAGSGLVRVKAGLQGFEAEFAHELRKKARELGSGPEDGRIPDGMAGGALPPSAEKVTGGSQDQFSKVVVAQALTTIAETVRDGRPDEAAQGVADSLDRLAHAGQVFAASDAIVEYAFATDPVDSLREWEREMGDRAVAELAAAQRDALRRWRDDHEGELGRFRNARNGLAHGGHLSDAEVEEAARLGWWLAADLRRRLDQAPLGAPTDPRGSMGA